MNGYSTAATLHYQPDLLARLQNVVRQLNRSDIRTTTTLIAKVLGNQNAAMMAVRLLHWFPRAKKAGGWVYKSWRDWDAECDLSQAQIKRVHNKQYLENIGIERKTMKANGTPTVHYRLDETRLVQRLADFLQVIPLQIQHWMRLEVSVENRSDRLTRAAQIGTFKETTQPDELNEKQPMNSAESAQSITDFDLQTQQYTNHQTTHNNGISVVVDIDGREIELFREFEKLGISLFKAKQLVVKYGFKRVSEVIQHTKSCECANPAGYAVRALEQNWAFWSKSDQRGSYGDVQSYVSGPFADYIEH
jgi:hypothetical protein